MSEACTHLIDGRNMTPPEPLERTLQALACLPAESELTLLLYCRPQPLFEILQQSGYAWTESIASDGTHTIIIRHHSHKCQG